MNLLNLNDIRVALNKNEQIPIHRFAYQYVLVLRGYLLKLTDKYGEIWECLIYEDDDKEYEYYDENE